MTSLLFFFVDGLGLGEDDPGINPARNFLSELTGLPFVSASSPAVFTEGVLAAAEAGGGVSGKPQSATGQSTLVTGINTPAHLGYHLTALPNEALAELIRQRGLLGTLAASGVRVTSSNLYTREFFLRRRRDGRNRLPVSTLSVEAAGVPFRFPEDYKGGRAVFADLTNKFLREWGHPIELISPRDAAERMTAILGEADFVFHEYFSTDTYAHKGRSEDLRRALDDIETFLLTLRRRTDPENTAILLVSDHGNCEDASSADHTLNPVPVLLLSRDEKARKLFSGITRLEEVYYAVLGLFGLRPEKDAEGQSSAALPHAP